VTDMPRVELEKCNGCGLCVSVCRCGAFVLIENIITVIETHECHWCIDCELICPTGAITCPFEIVIG